MRTRPWQLLVSAIGGALLALASLTPAASAANPRTAIRDSASPAASRTPSVGAVADDSSIQFEVDLKLPDQAAAESFAQAVSSPGSSQYGRYLTAAQWEHQFSPSEQNVDQVTAFLKRNGFTGVAASGDRMSVSATGTAAQVVTTFSTSLSYHRFDGRTLRLADRELSVPASIAGTISGVTGVSETLAQPRAARANPETGAPAAPGTQTQPGTFPQPPGFRVAPPCGASYNDQLDAMLPPFGNGYPADPPWAVCGYTPPQLRSAYSLSGPDDGGGATVAIVDAYASPTLFSDAHHYAELNDPSNPLGSSQFSELLASSFNQAGRCGPGGWFGEATLDVEAVHATAPGANILFAGAQSCTTDALNASLRQIVDGHLADVITNSYGDDGGDVLDTAGDRASTDDILLMAAGTGISVMFSSGDNGDEFTTIGQVAADYPSTSPWATAAGGTSLQIGSSGNRIGEFGWSTARSFLCNPTLVAQKGCSSAQLNTWLPIDQALDGGSGGGTSIQYAQPSWQQGVVPASLSEVSGSTPMRVEPDVSLDADPATGFLEGETQKFPDGVYYDQYRIGGTSVSSPLLAGIVARADETAGHPLGFLNPALYGLYGQSGAYDDVVPAGPQDQSRADYANSVDASQGLLYTTRIIDYEGPETFCTKKSCSTQNVALNAAPGYDNMTGLGAPGSGFVNALAGH
jgi:subtilase family serine protease